MSNGYRRGSVFGALMLIGIGGLFLYANLHPDFSAWALLAKYWPVLIIFWGLGELVDYLMLRGSAAGGAGRRGREPPDGRGGVVAGEARDVGAGVSAGATEGETGDRAHPHRRRR